VDCLLLINQPQKGLFLWVTIREKRRFIAPLSSEGLMSENGDFGVAVPQYADFFDVSRNTASSDFKLLLDKDSQTAID